MYRVFAALDQLVTIVEEARGVPMTASCVVPRGDVLDLLDDIRDAIPAELDDAQDVIDHRDHLLTTARDSAESAVGQAQEEAARLMAEAQAQATATYEDARAQAERFVAEATEQAEAILARAQADADRTIAEGHETHDQLVDRGRGEADRLVAAGRAGHDQLLAEGHAEQSRMVSTAEVVQAAHRESATIIDEASAEADRLRNECDEYVDSRLEELEKTLTKTLRTVGRGRTALRAGATADYRE